MERLGKRIRRSNETESDNDWSSIPNDILVLIFQKISRSIKGYARFSGVCRSWRSFATDPDNKPRFGPLHVSKIILGCTSITMKDPSSHQTLTLELPEPVGFFFCGSPSGWLINYPLPTISLINPFTGASIALPELPSTWECISSGYLTANPDSDPENCCVVIVTTHLTDKVAYIKPFPNGGSWKFLDLEDSFDFYGVTYFKGNLYGLRSFPDRRPTQVVSFQPNRRRCLARVTCLPRREDLNCPHKYLVDLDGQLCLCQRYCHYHFSETSTFNFKFFVINLLTGNLTPLLSLGDRCVFLDRNYSFAYKASYPPAKLFKRHEHAADELVSNYVFYYEGTDLQVWDMSHSCNVGMTSVPSSCRSLWMLLPLK